MNPHRRDSATARPVRSFVGLALVCTLALGACSSAAQTPNPAGSSSDGAGGGLTPLTPAAKGPLDSITWNLGGGEPTSLDYSYTWDTGPGNMVLANLCDNLMRQNPDSSYSPALASAVTTPDPTTYVYELRAGVTFSDGTPMTADDVAFSLQRQLDPDIGSYWGVWFQNVASVTATGPMQVTVKLKAPDVLFGQMMATSAGAVVQKAYVEAKGKDYGTAAGGVMCTGPYELTKWSSGTGITLTARDDYWDKTLQPKVKSINFTFVREPATVTNGLLTGSIDGTWTTPISGLGQLQAATNGKVWSNTGTWSTMLSMASFSGALKDPRIRQALQKSIDYQGITTGLLRGTATPAPAAVGPAYWGYAKDAYAAAHAALPPARQDLEGAKALVVAAGAPSSPIVLAFDAGDAIAASTVASIQDSAKKVGLAVELKPLPAATLVTLWYDPAARKGVDAIYSTSSGDIPEPLEVFAQFVSTSPLNYTGFVNPAYDDPIAQARATSDPAQRAALVAKGQAAAAEIVQTFLPLSNNQVLLYLNKRVTGAPVNSLSSLYYPWAATLGAP
ncbi:MAG: ABC transporter substrate-binding protein [Kineosporiaceae bacterium]|nr:ABC transporter substrate-binding protein [Kineosporiaceae bacterium]